MSHERKLNDGKRKKQSSKSLKEKRAEKKQKKDNVQGSRKKMRSNKTLLEGVE